MVIRTNLANVSVQSEINLKERKVRDIAKPFSRFLRYMVASSIGAKWESLF
jgi:hypothetical protein